MYFQFLSRQHNLLACGYNCATCGFACVQAVKRGQYVRTVWRYHTATVNVFEKFLEHLQDNLNPTVAQQIHYSHAKLILFLSKKKRKSLGPNLRYNQRQHTDQPRPQEGEMQKRLRAIP